MSDRFGSLDNGRQVRLHTIVNANGLQARLIDYGATLVALQVPDRDGRMADVVLGFDDVSGYRSQQNLYLGCTIGRVASRIAKGRFTLDGKQYRLALNEGPNHLHGGVERSLGRVLWMATPAMEGRSVRFTYTSPEGEEGYPGELFVAVTFTLTDGNALRIDYEATTNAPTPVSLTNHAYWNLSGEGSGSIREHRLWIAADRHTCTDEMLIPTGELEPVAGTPLDFRSPALVGPRIDALAAFPSRGIDHNFVLRGQPGRLREAARLEDPASGRVLHIETTEPCLEVYSGNRLDAESGKGGHYYKRNDAICLETQRFPDAVNRSSFPSVILRPGETYRSTTVHRFSVMRRP